MSKNRETIYLDELLMKIRENKEVGEIMGNAMIEIAKSCKTVQKEEMPHYKQIKREEVMSKLAENRDLYCVFMDGEAWNTKKVFTLKMETVQTVLSILKIEDVAFYEEVEENGVL